MTDVITLVSQQEGGAFGGVTDETRTEVFCGVASVGYNEFYKATAVNLKPEIKFILADYEDYAGQSVVEYGGTPYDVIRTYRTGTRLELVCQRRIGRDNT